MKKVLILGSDIGSEAMAQYIRSEGHYLIVTDYHPIEKSPVKKISDENWQISTMDIDALYEKCLSSHVEAIIAGISEYSIESAVELSEKLNLPYYTNSNTWKIVNNKSTFKKYCRKHRLPIAKDFIINDIPDKSEFPVVVKPVDGALNLGLSICCSKEELYTAYTLAYNASTSHRVLIESYIDGKLFGAFYQLIDGQIELSCVMESYHNQARKSCYYAIWKTESSFEKIYLEKYNEAVKHMLRDMGCINGTIFIQGLVSNSEMYFLEANYRLDGGKIFVPIKKYYGIDNVRLITDISLYGKTELQIIPYKKRDEIIFVYDLWAYKTCLVKSIRGLDEIMGQIDGIDCVNNCYEGQELLADYDHGVLLFVFSFSVKCAEEYYVIVNKINEMLSVLNEDGEDILDKIDLQELLC